VTDNYNSYYSNASTLNISVVSIVNPCLFT
jgi:hypothetical protein